MDTIDGEEASAAEVTHQRGRVLDVARLQAEVRAVPGAGDLVVVEGTVDERGTEMRALTAREDHGAGRGEHGNTVAAK